MIVGVGNFKRGIAENVVEGWPAPDGFKGTCCRIWSASRGTLYPPGGIIPVRIKFIIMVTRF